MRNDMACPTGREGEAARVREVVRQGGTCELVGNPGIGKTTLWRFLVGSFAAGRSLAVECAQGESRLGYGVLADLLGRAVALAGPMALSQLPVLHRSALRVITLQAPGDTVPVPIDARLAGTLLHTVLSAARGPVLVALDDLQWCDALSFAAIAYAARRADRRMISWLAARRPDSSQQLPGATIVDIEAFDASTLGDVLASHLDRRLPLPVLRTVTRVCGGNPLYALEIARELPPDARPGDVRLPPTLFDSVAARIAALPARTRRRLLHLAVGEGPGDGPAAEDDLAAAMAQGFVRASASHRWVLTHPLYAEAIIRVAAPAALTAAHREAAARSSDRVAAALHLIRSDPPRNSHTRRRLYAAACAAAARGDLHSAAELSEGAIAYGGDSEPPWALLHDAARWAIATYDPRARDLADRAVDRAATPNQRCDALLTLSELHVLGLAEAHHVASRAAQQNQADPSKRALALARCGRLQINLGELPAAAATLTDALDATPPGTGTWAGLVGDASLARRLSGHRVDNKTLAQAGALARRHRLPRAENPLVSLGLIAMYDDRHEDARSAFDTIIDEYDGTSFDDEARFHLAELECRTGNLTSGYAIARTLIGRLDGHDLAGPLWVLAIISAWMGNQSDCRLAAARIDTLAARTGDGIFRAAGKTAVGFLDLTLRRYRDASKSLGPAAELLDRHGFIEPSCFPVLPAAAEAAAWCGDLGQAHRYCSDLDRAADALNSRWAEAAATRARADIDAAQREQDSAITGYTKAIDMYESLLNPLNAARTYLARGIAHRHARHHHLARLDLQHAAATLEEAGATILAADARSELTKLGGRQQPASNTLSTTESQLARIVAAGSSNADAAQALHLSIKTVETHLTHIYRKLGISNRHELANTLDLL